MAITRVAAGTFANTPNDFQTPQNLVPGMPAGWAQDDLGLLFIACDWNQGTAGTITTPVGYTEFVNLFTTSGGTQYLELRILRRVLQTGDTAPTVVIAGGTIGTAGTAAGARIMALRGTNILSDPIQLATGYTNSAQTTGTIGPVPGITPAVDGAMVFVVGARGSNWVSVDQLAGFTEDFENPVSASGKVGIVVDSVIQTTATAVTDQTFTVTSGGNGVTVGQTFAVNPPAVAGTGAGQNLLLMGVG